MDTGLREVAFTVDGASELTIRWNDRRDLFELRWNQTPFSRVTAHELAAGHVARTAPDGTALNVRLIGPLSGEAPFDATYAERALKSRPNGWRGSTRLVGVTVTDGIFGGETSGRDSGGVSAEAPSAPSWSDSGPRPLGALPPAPRPELALPTAVEGTAAVDSYEPPPGVGALLSLEVAADGTLSTSGPTPKPFHAAADFSDAVQPEVATIPADVRPSSAAAASVSALVQPNSRHSAAAENIAADTHRNIAADTRRNTSAGNASTGNASTGNASTDVPELSGPDELDDQPRRRLPRVAVGAVAGISVLALGAAVFVGVGKKNSSDVADPRPGVVSTVNAAANTTKPSFAPASSSTVVTRVAAAPTSVGATSVPVPTTLATGTEQGDWRIEVVSPGASGRTFDSVVQLAPAGHAVVASVLEVTNEGPDGVSSSGAIRVRSVDGVWRSPTPALEGVTIAAANRSGIEDSAPTMLFGARESVLVVPTNTNKSQLDKGLYLYNEAGSLAINLPPEADFVLAADATGIAASTGDSSFAYTTDGKVWGKVALPTSFEPLSSTSMCLSRTQIHLINGTTVYTASRPESSDVISPEWSVRSLPGLTEPRSAVCAATEDELVVAVKIEVKSNGRNNVLTSFAHASGDGPLEPLDWRSGSLSPAEKSGNILATSTGQFFLLAQIDENSSALVELRPDGVLEHERWIASSRGIASSLCETDGRLYVGGSNEGAAVVWSTPLSALAQPR